jgi:hypothetical protein
MTEQEYIELVRQGRCPAEVIREQGVNIPASCDRTEGNCREYLKEVLK